MDSSLTTTVKLSEVVGKPHNRVLSSVKSMNCTDSFRSKNYFLDKYEIRGKDYPMYRMTKNGLLFLMMNCTGPKMSSFKEEYFECGLGTIYEIYNAIFDIDIPDMDVYIYVAQDEKGRLKLGISHDPEKRVKCLNTGNAEKLKLVGFKRANSRKEETIAHKKLKNFKIRSEWYCNDKMVLDYIQP